MTEDVARFDVRRARRFARAVVEHYFGSPPRRLVSKSGGITNFVFEANHSEGDFIVRLSPEPGKIKDFLKEQWAILNAGKAGVPTVEVLEVGTEVVPFPYMIARKAVGEEASNHPDRHAILEEMGRITARIHSVQTKGYGNSFDWSHNRLSHRETWREHLRTELKVEERLEFLHACGLVSRDQHRRLRSLFREAEAWTEPSVLHHGDMRLKNVLVGDCTVTAVLDWEYCVSSIAPFWDLSVALHDLSIDGKHAFLSGYGLSPARIREIAPYVRAFNFLHYACAAAGAESEREADRMEGYRLRLSGALDLYCV